MSFCQNCGSPAQGNFCNNCGSKLNTPITTNMNLKNNYAKPKFRPAIILLVLLWVSSSGQYLNEFEEFNLAQANIYALIDITVLSILMLFYPFISRLINKEQIEYYECKKICMANSIILFIISLILTATIGVGFVGGLGALMYYFINMNLFSAPKIEKPKIKKEINISDDDYIYNPSLSDIENQKERFSQMDILALDDLIKNKKNEYTDETYAIALEQYKIRSSELQNSQKVAELQEKISQLDETLLNLNQMLSQAKKDLGNLTIDDVENMYRQKLISETQKNEMINSIEVLQTAITMTPQNIIATQKLKTELEEELKKLQEV